MNRKYYFKYMNIPFKHLGRDFNGVDCYGLMLLYAKEEFGIELKDWYYEPDWSKKQCDHIMDNYSSIGHKIDKLCKHDIVLLFTDINTRVVNHTAILVEEPYLCIHAGKTGVGLLSLNSALIKRRIEGYYRINK